MLKPNSHWNYQSNDAYKLIKKKWSVYLIASPILTSETYFQCYSEIYKKAYSKLEIRMNYLLVLAITL